MLGLSLRILALACRSRKPYSRFQLSTRGNLLQIRVCLGELLGLGNALQEVVRHVARRRVQLQQVRQFQGVALLVGVINLNLLNSIPE